MKRTIITLVDADHDEESSASETTLAFLVGTYVNDATLRRKLLAAIDEYGRTQFGRGYVRGGEDERRGRY